MTKNHTDYLNELVDNLWKINEESADVHWMIKEGTIIHRGISSGKTFCDLIVIYYNGYGVPIELKRSNLKKDNSLDRLESGKDFIQTTLRFKCPYGKIVTYGNKGYNFDTVYFDKFRKI